MVRKKRLKLAKKFRMPAPKGGQVWHSSGFNCYFADFSWNGGRSNGLANFLFENVLYLFGFSTTKTTNGNKGRPIFLLNNTFTPVFCNTGRVDTDLHPNEIFGNNHISFSN